MARTTENFLRSAREARKNRGLTQEEMATVIGKTRVGFVHFETGRKKITLGEAIALADFYNLSLDEMCEGGNSNDDL